MDFRTCNVLFWLHVHEALGVPLMHDDLVCRVFMMAGTSLLVQVGCCGEMRAGAHAGR